MSTCRHSYPPPPSPSPSPTDRNKENHAMSLRVLEQKFLFDFPVILMMPNGTALPISLRGIPKFSKFLFHLILLPEFQEF